MARRVAEMTFAEMVPGDLMDLIVDRNIGRRRHRSQRSLPLRNHARMRWAA
jgi:hypothetical protein